MKTAKTRLALSVLVVLAMVSSGLGVGILSMRQPAQVSNPAGNLGTRSEQAPEVVSATGSIMNEGQEDSLPTNADTPETSSTEVTPLYRKIGHEEAIEINDNLATSSASTTTVENRGGGTRNPGFDIQVTGDGPDCFEGSCVVHFEIVTDDPTLIFFRWDFNNDGVWDTPWVTEKTYDKMFMDNYYNNVCAEGWDGVSTKTIINTGDNLNQRGVLNYYIYPMNSGWKFRAKADISVTELGYWKYSAYTYSSFNIRIWDFATRAELGRCTPPTAINNQYNWCILSTPVPLITGKEYMISYHKAQDYSPYWTGITNSGFSWTMVEYQGYWYKWSYQSPSGQGFPSYDGATTAFVPNLDFRWRQVIILPLTVGACALCDVNNAPPRPFDIATDPSPALEGTPVSFTAKFDDPGLDDTWQYRWYFGDGTWSPWQSVKKFSGGANVLLYHTVTGSIATFKQQFIDMCGEFCTKVDDYDFGPLGTGTDMTLAQLMEYDVIWVDTYYGPLPDPVRTGNLLADYMDAKGSQGSGGVVVNGRGPYYQGSTWEIRGRYFTDQYSPLPPGTSWWSWSDIGTIYVPGHPILDGINSLRAYARVSQMSVNPGATRIADFVDGRVLLATKENPKVNNGARAVGMPFRTWSGTSECTGDCVKIAYNAMRWASRMPDPTPLSMPLQLAPITHNYNDDDPVTTSPWDAIDIKVEVKDDDDGKIEGITTLVGSENFQSGCNYPSWPPGWVATPSIGWRCQSNTELTSNSAVFRYYYNDRATSLLTSPMVDMSSFNFAKLEWRNYWYANYAGAYQDGYVEVSVDGGLTYPYILQEYHHNQPGGPETKVYASDIPTVSSTMMLRFRINSGFDWYWIVDDIKVYGTMGRMSHGLGESWSATAIANVPPSIVGGPALGLRDENVGYEISGMQISDPALMQPTEWFAYKMDFDDGMTAPWVYKGTLAPPRSNILIINSLCGGGNTCSDYMSLASMLSALDVTGTVTGFDFFGQLAAPSLSYMMGFDIIIFASNYAYIGSPAFDAARLAIGNNLASYMDSGRGGFISFMFTFDLSSTYGDLFGFLGRYMDQRYGPFVPAIYTFTPATLGTVLVPDHPVMKGVRTVSGLYTGSGDLQTTPGGIKLANNNGGGTFAGVKELANGARTCSLQLYGGGISGADASKLMRNCVGWAAGGIPSPEIPPVTHTWGDNGLYTVDVTLIDDDMGWTWDPIDNVPVAHPNYPQTLAHHYVPVEVNNVDPTISSTGAYTMTDLCLRLSGNKGNDAVLTVMGSDGSMYSVRTSRVPGQPAVGCLPTITIDMTPSTKYTLTIAYDPTGDDGANPEWIFSSTWPDGKIKELRYTFNSNDGPSVVTIDNKQFKQLAIGSPITFEATAYDPGSDDLAFVWDWGQALPYTIHAYRHPGVFYADFQAALLNEFPFDEPKFVKADNSIRSPEVDPMRAHDIATHTFDPINPQLPLYVMFAVVDDDNGNPYPSHLLYPGMDMMVIQIDV